MSAPDFTFSLCRIPFNEDYEPAATTRATTNFANLARGESRQENLRNALRMIENRFNSLAHWDNPRADRYAIELDIVSVSMALGETAEADGFPIIEMLQTTIVDRTTSEGAVSLTLNILHLDGASRWWSRSFYETAIL